MSPTQAQSQAVAIENEDMNQNQTDNNLAQRSYSVTSDDILYDDQVLGTTKYISDNVTSEDQDVLLEINTEEQEQFEVLDSADGDEDQSMASNGMIDFHACAVS